MTSVARGRATQGTVSSPMCIQLHVLGPGRQLVEDSAMGQALLSRTLPLTSLHMTVCGWDDIGQAECRQRVHQALAGFERACGGWFRACGVTVHPSGNSKCIRLHVRGIEPAAPWAVVRDVPLAITGNQGHEPTDDKLHINLGWYKLWSPPRDQEGIACRSLDPALAALQEALVQTPAVGAADGSLPGLRSGELPLRCPHLSHYRDMATFSRNCEPAAIAPGPGTVLCHGPSSVAANAMVIGAMTTATAIAAYTTRPEAFPREPQCEARPCSTLPCVFRLNAFSATLGRERVEASVTILSCGTGLALHKRRGFTVKQSLRPTRWQRDRLTEPHSTLCGHHSFEKASCPTVSAHGLAPCFSPCCSKRLPWTVSKPTSRPSIVLPFAIEVP